MKEKAKLIGKELERLVKNAKNYQPDEVKIPSGLGETVASTGINLTRPEILRDILKPNFAEGTIYERCKKFDVSDKANGLFMVVTKQSTRTTAAGILGGFMAYNVGEGEIPTYTKGQFDQTQLYLNQKGVVCVVTNALLQDSIVLSEYLSNGFKETINYYTDYEILYGSGTTGCNGILLDGDRATKYVTLSSTLAVTDLKNMMKYYYGGKDACWVMSYDMWLEVLDLYANTLPLEFHKNGEATLFGYPVIVKDNMGSRHIVLGDFSQYLFAQKPIREDMSEHLLFDSNQSVFRTIMRMNGMPIWYSPITTQDGFTVYPFVAGTNTDTKSSSSSSSGSSVSSLSSPSSSDNR